MDSSSEEEDGEEEEKGVNALVDATGRS